MTSNSGRQTVAPALVKPRTWASSRSVSALWPVLACLAGLSSGLVQGENLGKLRLFGYIEPAMLMEGGVVLEAKLDTGADNSSIHAPDWEIFKKNGKDWVRFSVEGEKGTSAILEREIKRIAKIEQRAGRNAERPVVMLRICVGDVAKTVEVNLADRSDLEYPMLIGRSFLAHGVLVNSAEKITSQPQCRKEPGL